MNFLNVLKAAAPAIATALGGPAAGIGVKFLADKFLGNPDATEEQVYQAVEQATPEDMIKLRELDNQFWIEHGKRIVELIQIDAQTVASAQNRQVELAKVGINDNTPRNLAYFNNFGLFAMSLITCLMLTYNLLDAAESAIFGLVLGVWISKSTQGDNYYLGSSSGSRAKDDLIKRKDGQ